MVSANPQCPSAGANGKTSAAPSAGACPQHHAASQREDVQRVAGLVEARLVKGGRMGRFTMEQVAQHNHKDSGWVVVDGKVYDITHHVLTHPGWTSGCATSQLLAILRTLGTDCTEEVYMVHSPKALRQFQPYMIGTLVRQEQEQQHQQTA